MTSAAADVEEVRAALERYNAARAELDAAADAGVALLRARSASAAVPDDHRPDRCGLLAERRRRDHFPRRLGVRRVPGVL